MGDVAISVKHVCKYYEDFLAVAGIDLEIHKGKIFGIVGPHGAGKTTLIKMISGLISQSIGKINVLGYDFATNEVEIKKRIGFLPEDSPLYENMRVMDYLIFFSEIFGVQKDIATSRIQGLLTALDLSPNRKKIGELPKGMERKVAIARSLINDHEIIIYDEPTSGLDPMTSKYIVDFIRELKGQGKTIIFSAHNLYQVESICDRILIMNNGKEIVKDFTKDIINRYGRTEYQIEFRIDDASGLHFDGMEQCNEHYRIRTSSIDDINRITRKIIEHDGDIVEVRTPETPLEEIFLELVRGLKAAAKPLKPHLN
ncbi:MAG: ABC transporter ATP-binding protein [Euryarchaeota archaeon]|nr:ABC transporter ATP-binding protein [Euryarchaeota archaeon]